MSSPRQPFGVLDSPRRSKIASLKNRQNALPYSLSSPVKRRRSPSSTAFDDFDSENVDPSMFMSPSKRAKNVDGLPTKKSHFVLTDAPSTPSHLKPSPARPIARSTVRLDSPRAPLGQKRKASPVPSVPTPAAGRSPKSKRIGILSRHRTSSPFTRVDPPTYSQSRNRSSMPFSIDAALGGTISGYKARRESKPLQQITVPTLEESVPKGWIFEIYEDTADEEMANLMQHSTYTLDISDDESRRAGKDERGKENIPPLDHTPTPTSVNSSTSEPAMSPVDAGVRMKTRRSAKSMMTDDERAPLGNLAPEDFYADGLDASSFVLVQDAPTGKSIISREVKEPSFVTPPRPRINPLASKKDEQKDFLESLEGTTRRRSAPTFPALERQEKTDEILIWESSSEASTATEIEECAQRASGGASEMDAENADPSRMEGKSDPDVSMA
ncbi:MAG: hypothetical protein M1819_002903 [Sarea resinae]|nr:MAG: hypothetical protein M1819_002903 [Sarea resinae]